MMMDEFWLADVISVIDERSVPALPAPNVRGRTVTGAGQVHRTVWARRWGRLVAYPACRVEHLSLEPGKWTDDEVTCKHCQARQASGQLARPPAPGTLLALAAGVRVWAHVVDLVAPLAKEVLTVMVFDDDTAEDRALIDRLATVYRELRLLPAQCHTPADGAAARDLADELKDALFGIMIDRGPGWASAA
ncbi:hypothetical protein [Nakamurella endophytica]|uniref:Uncharacterized protein n=1 Tax=Nakamurella endophytica TaxID=1748367 RepID=A0A917TD05_9ACTN|nr:hypothetical protein [Nakamurella endophytica]GGM16094.1 hypothetical protein GCM10011594_40130 [Nakamurella endophytica]